MPPTLAALAPPAAAAAAVDVSNDDGTASVVSSRFGAGGTAFSAASSFEGPRKGFVFKMGNRGLGYYLDVAVLDPAEARLKKNFLGNMSWLSEEPAEAEPPPAAAAASAAPAEASAAAPPPPPPGGAPSGGAGTSTALALPGGKPTSTALALPGKRVEEPREPGRLTERRKAILEKQAGPFAPALAEGKYTEKGEVVKVYGKRWALVVEIKTNHFTCMYLDSEQREVLMFHDLQTTQLSLAKFLAAKAKWDKRAPLSKKVLQDDRRGHVHKSWTGPPISTAMRLTDKTAFGAAQTGKKGYYLTDGSKPPPPPEDASSVSSASSASSKPEPGSGKGYYYAAVTSDKRTMPSAQPVKIDAKDVATEAEQGEEPIARKSNYYYAHRRKIDFHVPTPAPQRIG